jgi:hypothetical protein
MLVLASSPADVSDALNSAILIEVLLVDTLVSAAGTAETQKASKSRDVS